MRKLVLTAAAALVLGVSAAQAAPTAAVTRLAVPPDGTTYLAMGVRWWDTTDPGFGDTRTFEARMKETIANELGGKRPAFLWLWAPWQKLEAGSKAFVPFREYLGDIRRIQGVTGPDSPVYLDWTLTATSDENGGLTVADVAAGGADSYVRTFAREARAYGKPLLVRLFGGDFNTDHWHGLGPRANPSLTPAHFTAAWRRVVDAFRAERALNVSFAWIPAAFPAGGTAELDSGLEAYWPGDGYVDWAGASLFDRGGTAWLDGPYAFARAHGKPFFLAEWGVRHGASTLTPAQQRQWIADVLGWVAARPSVKAISYFNVNSRPYVGPPVDPARLVCTDGRASCWQREVNDFDHRLAADSGAGWAQAFARAVASKRYASNAATRAAEADAALLEPVVSGSVATMRWQANPLARTYDIAVRKAGGGWVTIVQRLNTVDWNIGAGDTITREATVSYKIRGAPGSTIEVRVRARDAVGRPGPWSKPRPVSFAIAIAA